MQKRRLASVFAAAAILVAPRAFAQETPPAPAEPVPAEPVPGSADAAPPPATEEEEPVVIVTAPESEAKLASGIKGRLTDAKTGEGLIEATIKVVRGGKGQAITDVDGNYELALPPGEYELRVYYELYKGRRITDVVVREGQIVQLDVALDPDTGAVQEVVVEGKADPKSESANLQERKKAAVVQDTVSSQEISRTPDSNAGDAVKRVVSATVVGGKYVFVRGLGGRYSITLLNGVPLPSPDPDNPAVPLDLFPASLLANLTVVKSYMADLPGTFSGGALLIETNAYPEDFEFKLRFAGNFDSTSTFRNRETYAGGAYDWLGFDSGARALPRSVPGDRSVDTLTPEQNTKAARAFGDVWNVDSRGTAYPNWSLGANVGDTVNVGSNKVGYLATVTYGQKYVTRVADTARVLRPEMPYASETAEIAYGEQQISWGALGNVGIDVDRNNSVNLFMLYSRAAEDRGYTETGTNVDDLPYERVRLQYQARQLGFWQLTGRHELPSVADLELRWQGNFALTSRDEPNTRDLSYLENDVGELYFVEAPLSGERFFSTLGDISGGGGLQLALPTSVATFKVGGSLQTTSREFDARRLGYKFIGTDSTLLAERDPDVMFATNRMGTDWKLIERTQPDDSYTANRTIAAGYAMADVTALSPFRLVAGLRYEVSTQTINVGSDIVPGVEFEEISRDDADLLPAASLIWAATDKMNLRASYAYTLARPQFRELAPFLYYDFTRRRSITGNPGLINTQIHNVDLRWELFPAEREVIAASAFYKRFNAPIELIAKSPTLDSLYENTGDCETETTEQGSKRFVSCDGGADVLGAELEARGSFGRFSPALKNFRGAVNATFVWSEIDLSKSMGSFYSLKRPLQGQSPYVVNVDLGWADETQGLEISVLYNVYGRRLAEVGQKDVFDVYEDAFHRVDLSASLRTSKETKLKLSGTNLLNQPIVFKQGPLEVQRYEPGVGVSLSLEWAPK